MPGHVLDSELTDQMEHTLRRRILTGGIVACPVALAAAILAGPAAGAVRPNPGHIIERPKVQQRHHPAVVRMDPGHIIEARRTAL